MEQGDVTMVFQRYIRRALVTEGRRFVVMRGSRKNFGIPECSDPNTSSAHPANKLRIMQMLQSFHCSPLESTA